MSETPVETTPLVLRRQVKVLFVRNLASTVTEEILEKAFSQFGKLERVKKLKDYAFIHFEERDGAVKVRLPPPPPVDLNDLRYIRGGKSLNQFLCFDPFCRLCLI